MKYYTFINKNEEEKVLIYAKERNAFVIELEKLAASSGVSITGTNEGTIIKIEPMDVTCFVSENNKVFAIIDDKRYQIKERLYQLEDMDFNTYFVKLNQSCYANMKQIKEFKASFGGAILVIFNNGYKDYIARRELKNVKERMGL